MRTMLFFLLVVGTLFSSVRAEDSVTRVFIFAGQSNMVGSDSHAEHIERFPPFAGLDEPQKDVRFSYVIGREDKRRSDGWVPLAPVDGVVGPELSFARKVSSRIDAPVAIVKVAAGGTHLGGDWNPDEPTGFRMYPLLLETVRASLAELDAKGVRYRLEGLMWHQGENDMFEDGFEEAYGANLASFIACVRRDLEVPELRVYVGELCTKTVWGMDMRPHMDAIARGQKAATTADPLAQYVPTSHVAVEIGGGAGLHYHYGTLGQLEHGVNYADAYLANVGLADEPTPSLAKWPVRAGKEIELFVLAGHRNMEGERAFVQHLAELKGGRGLAAPNVKIPYRYDVGGGFRVSNGWEALAPSGPYDTFGPELSFGRTLAKKLRTPFAIAKFTHSGSQIVDWTPAGSEAEDRNLYPAFIAFVRAAIADLEERGHRVKLAGIVYHVGENDMSFHPYREAAAERLATVIERSRADLELPELTWFVSQQAPTDDESVNGIDVVARVAEMAAADPHCVHLRAFEPPPQAEQLVFDTAGVVWLGEWLAEQVLARR
ncbi:hypothetical protein Pla163_17680 [Planctomycetes bacterium Pla163]|uniref:Sialate O-acetylesterase domain-containing protein n=1 Tax=Rohdeia mirabilis TaxID=2528008 RepID=A0A518CZK2_9BACT|nr:hypothetical protein Pla163_17680 [Planctomycetes bacterium Pla163]